MAATAETMSDPFRKLLWVIPKSEEKLMEHIKSHDAANTSSQSEDSVHMVEYAEMEFCTVHDIPDLTHQLKAVVVPALRKDLFQYAAIVVPAERDYIYKSMEMLEYLSKDVDMKEILHTRLIGILPFHRRVDHFEQCTPAMARMADNLIIETMKVRQKVKFHRMRDIICCAEEQITSQYRASEIFDFVMEYWDYEKHITGPGQPPMDRCKHCGHPYGWHYATCADLEEAKKEKESILQDFNVGKNNCHHCKDNSPSTDEKECKSDPEEMKPIPDILNQPLAPPLPPLPELVPQPMHGWVPKPKPKPKQTTYFPGACYKCGAKGHRAANCPLFGKPPFVVANPPVMFQPRAGVNGGPQWVRPPPPFCMTCQWAHQGACQQVGNPPNPDK